MHIYNIVWASTYPTSLSRIVLLQKRIIRIINHSKFDAHTDPIFKDLRILKFHDTCKLKTGQFVYLCRSKLLPKIFNEMYDICNTHSHYTRSLKTQLKTPFCRTKLRQFAVSYQGSKLYNSLSEEIIHSNSLSIFTIKLKDLLFSEYGKLF